MLQSVLGRPQKDLRLEDIGLELPDSAWFPASWTLPEAFTKAETVFGWYPVNYLFKAVEDDSNFVLPTFQPPEIAAFLNGNNFDIKASGDSRSPSSRQMLLHAMFYAIFRAIALRDYGGNIGQL